uniref:Uncharacterized protein n=1 Tax=Oryza brachyantha TaxID=4533 RepID=J3LDW8_ORYBR
MGSLVVERAESLRVGGVALNLHANGWRALEELGVADDLRRTATLITSKENRCLRRKDVVEALAKNVTAGTIRYGCQVVAIHQDPATNGALLTTADGKTIKAKVHAPPPRPYVKIHSSWRRSRRRCRRWCWSRRRSRRRNTHIHVKRVGYGSNFLYPLKIQRVWVYPQTKRVWRYFCPLCPIIPVPNHVFDSSGELVMASAAAGHGAGGGFGGGGGGGIGGGR